MRCTHVLVGIATLGAAAIARADIVVFSTFGPGDSFDQFNGVFTQGGGELGFSFTPSQSGRMSLLRAPLYERTSPPFQVQLDVYRRTSTVPGDLLFRTFVTPPLQQTQFVSPVLYPIANGPMLVLGTTYYITASRVGPTGTWDWKNSSPLVFGDWIEHPDGFPWSLNPNLGLPAFEISIVPAAPTLTTILGAAAVAARRRRRA